MNITVEKLPKCTANIRAEIPADQVNAAKKQITNNYASQAQIPGFRPGKTPKSVIEKRYATQIAEELEGQLVQSAFQKAVQDDSTLQILHSKKAEEFTFNGDNSASFTVPVILSPEFELQEYKNIAIEVPSEEVTEEEKANTLTDLQQRFANYSDVEDGRGLVSGDLAVINYEGKIDGKSVTEAIGEKAAFLGGREDYWVKMDAKAFLPGFTDQLIDAKVGETRSVSVTVAADFPVEEARNQTIDYNVEITSIKTEELPEIDDAFAEKLIPEGNLEKLHEAINEQLSGEKKQRISRMKEELILEQIVGQYDFEMPEDFLTSETQRQVNLIAQQGMEQGFDSEAMEAQEDQIIGEAEKRANNSLKTNFLLNKIAQKEAIDVNQAELLQTVESYARQENQPVKKFIKGLNQDQISNIRQNLIFSKTVNFLVEQAKITTTVDSDESAN